MSDYKMDIKGCLGLSEYSKIHDYFGMIDKNDRFRITLEKSNDKEIGIINSMLQKFGFFIYEQGYESGGIYYINTFKI